MKFNEYVKEYRLRHFSDLNKFAKILGVEKIMWRKIERGINPPPRKALLNKFANLTKMKEYEKNQMYALAKRWKPSPDTNTARHSLVNANSQARWIDAIIKENTPDYEHKYWGKRT